MERRSKAIVEGFILHDAELEKTSKTKKTFILFTIAINHYSKPGEPGRVSFIEIEAWGYLAEEVAGKIKKGQRVVVLGDLRQDRWTGENDKICSRIKLFATEIRFKEK